MRFQKVATTTTLLAELSHVCCCGLPIFVAVVSAGSQIGLVGGFATVHAWMHVYEVPLLVGSGSMLIFGASLQYLSFRLDCRSTGCAHDDCRPKKFRVSWILGVAIALYAVNIVFYFLSGHGS